MGRKAVYEVEITEGAIRVRAFGRVLTLPAAPPGPEVGEDGDFVVRLDEIDHWDAPQDEETIDIAELQKILAAIEDQAEKHGLTIVFE